VERHTLYFPPQLASCSGYYPKVSAKEVSNRRVALQISRWNNRGTEGQYQNLTTELDGRPSHHHLSGAGFPSTNYCGFSAVLLTVGCNGTSSPLWTR
jgi:hypothetical protein